MNKFCKNHNDAVVFFSSESCPICKSPLANFETLCRGASAANNVSMVCLVDRLETIVRKFFDGNVDDFETLVYSNPKFVYKLLNLFSTENEAQEAHDMYNSVDDPDQYQKALDLIKDYDDLQSIQDKLDKYEQLRDIFSDMKDNMEKFEELV